jgi:signal transduction histidine kinase
VTFPVKHVRARFIRVTATKLWERSNDYIFALAELEAYSGGKNVAIGAAVTSLDSIEATTWSRRFLVNGFNSQGRILELGSWLRGLSRRREIGVALRQLEDERGRQAASLTTWATRWTVLVGLLVAAGMVWGGQRRAHARRKEVERLRQRIASDLHDEIGSNLATIALLSHLAQRQGGPAQEDLAEISRVARETANSMRDIVWLIKPGAEDAGDFVAKLRETAALMLTGLEWQFHGEGLSSALSLEWKREILLIFKEALHNIRRHASAQRVTIRLAEEDDELVMEIADDGSGFDVQGSTTGHGLASQRQRAQSLGGELRIASQPGEGTIVTLRAKLDSAARLEHS